MGAIYEKFAFPHIPCSYDKTLPHLKFISRSDGHFVPLCHFILDSNLPTLLMSDGNSGCLKDQNVEELAYRFNANIVRYEYSGRGLHTSRTMCESECERDIIAVYNYLVKNDITNIFILGYSIGTYFSCYLASKVCCYKHIKGLILVSPFKTITKTMTNLSLPGDFCKTENLVKYITCPVLVIHGNCDMLCQIKHSIDMSSHFINLYDYVIISCGHHRICFHPHYYQAVIDFIHKI
jgi:pimeloyl-ACP methyl ester carboxylesterase